MNQVAFTFVIFLIICCFIIPEMEVGGVLKDDNSNKNKLFDFDSIEDSWSSNGDPWHGLKHFQGFTTNRESGYSHEAIISKMETRMQNDGSVNKNKLLVFGSIKDSGPSTGGPGHEPKHTQVLTTNREFSHNHEAIISKMKTIRIHKDDTSNKNKSFDFGSVNVSRLRSGGPGHGPKHFHVPTTKRESGHNDKATISKTGAMPMPKDGIINKNKLFDFGSIANSGPSKGGPGYRLGHVQVFTPNLELDHNREFDNSNMHAMRMSEDDTSNKNSLFDFGSMTNSGPSSGGPGHRLIHFQVFTPNRESSTPDTMQMPKDNIGNQNKLMDLNDSGPSGSGAGHRFKRFQVFTTHP